MNSGMHQNNVAITALSTLGAVFWSIQLIPQIWINWRRKSGDGLQPSMMICWSLAGVPLGIHNILGRQPIALQIQAQILTSLSLLTWSQVMYYDHKWSFAKCATLLSIFAVLLGGIETAFVLGFRSVSDTKVKENAILAMAILAAIGLSIGVLRHYWDIYTHRTVRGIAWGFVLLDAAGDLTSLLSVTISSPADPVAAAIYASELSLWIGIMIAGLVFNARFFIQRRLSLRDESPSPEDVQTNPALARIDSINSVSSAFSRIIPESRQDNGNWLLRRIRR